MKTNRRQFLRSAAGAPAVLAVGSVVPRYLLHAAEQGSDAGRVLVVVQMTGGNDGLNTVIPFRHDEYHKLRPTLAFKADEVLNFNPDYGFHPQLRGFADLLEHGQLSIIQGVGYEHPNRSHFESMDIWHTCQRKGESRNTGWLGRVLDASLLPTKGDVPAMHFGQEKQPMALAAANVRVPSVNSVEQFKLNIDESESVEMVRSLVESERHAESGLLDFVQSTSTSALDVSERFQLSSRPYDPKRPYPESALGNKLLTIARLIDAGLTTRIYYVELDGFDTHSQQAPAHDGLMRQLGDAVGTFVNDLGAHGHGQRVTVMCFSEFGRRLAENASEGTDHGAAAPMFLAGQSIISGQIGKHPSLTDLDEGDLKHHTDFRQVYASVLENWLGCDSKQILGASYKPLKLFV